MLMGAFFGIWGARPHGQWVARASSSAMAAGGLLALVHAFFCIHLRADQIVGGTAINFLALGITGYRSSTSTATRAPRPTSRPGSRIDFLGFLDVDPGQSATSCRRLRRAQPDDLGRASFVLVVMYIVIFKTSLGLRIRAVGEHPRAADTVGISVYGIRYGAVVLSGVLAAARRRVPLGRLRQTLRQNMTAGRGFIALAALIFGNWRPFGAAIACLLFGFSSALARPAAGVLERRRRDISSTRCRTCSRSSRSRASSGARSRRGRRASVRQAVAWRTGGARAPRGARDRGAGVRRDDARRRVRRRASATATTCCTPGSRSPSPRARLRRRSRSPGARACARRSRSRAEPRASPPPDTCSGSSGFAWRASALVALGVYGLLEYVGSRD